MISISPKRKTADVLPEIDPHPTRRTPEEVSAIFERWQKDNPAPQSELKAVNSFTFLVAVVLSAQSTDVAVNKATKGLFQRATTPQDMLELGSEILTEHLRTIGLYRNKVKYVLSLSQQLIDRHGGEVPDDRTSLEALPGVGRKTASVVLNSVFGHPTVAVDTHIFRVSNRMGLTSASTSREVENQLLQVTPERYLKDSHHWLILHGRYVCTSRKPKCEKCMQSDLCKAKENPFRDSERPAQPGYAIGDQDTRPWGTWKIIDVGTNFAVKRITVNPNCRLSLQYHHHREEHWTIVCGEASVTLGKRIISMQTGAHIHIPKTKKHRIQNTGAAQLVFIEVQLGDRLEETDIVRIEDDFNRT